MHADAPIRCDGRPSAIRPATPCAVCMSCIWRWTPESETYPRFRKPPIRMAGREWVCDQRCEHEHSVGADSSSAHPAGLGGAESAYPTKGAA